MVALGPSDVDDERPAGVIIVTSCISAVVPASVPPSSPTLAASPSNARRDVIDVAMDTDRRLPETRGACVMNMFADAGDDGSRIHDQPVRRKVAIFAGYVSSLLMYNDFGNVSRPPGN